MLLLSIPIFVKIWMLLLVITCTIFYFVVKIKPIEETNILDDPEIEPDLHPI